MCAELTKVSRKNSIYYSVVKRLSLRNGNLHRFVYKNGVAPRKIAVKGCSHHHQGIRLSAEFETRIDFEKTCGTDLFCNSVPRKKQITYAICFFQLRNRWFIRRHIFGTSFPACFLPKNSMYIQYILRFSQSQTKKPVSNLYRLIKSAFP